MFPGIKLAASYTKFFDDVVNKLETIGHLLQCFRIYSTTPGYLEPMRPLLVRTYKSVLTFWRSAAALFSRSGETFTATRSSARLLLCQALKLLLEVLRNLLTHALQNWLVGSTETLKLSKIYPLLCKRKMLRFMMIHRLENKNVMKTHHLL